MLTVVFNAALECCCDDAEETEVISDCPVFKSIMDVVSDDTWLTVTFLIAIVLNPDMGGVADAKGLDVFVVYWLKEVSVFIPETVVSGDRVGNRFVKVEASIPIIADVVTDDAPGDVVITD